MNDHLLQEIAKLRLELADEKAMNEYLMKLFVDSGRYPSKFRLTAKEATMLNCMVVSRGICSKEKLAAAIGYEGNHIAKHVDVYIFWIRKKLVPFGVEIENHYGEGFYINEANRKRLNQSAGISPEPVTRRIIETQWRELRETKPS